MFNMTQSPARSLAFIAVFAALIAALGFVAIPMGSLGVPIVLQNMGALLAGIILGWKRGALATALFVAISFLGLPILAGGRTGLAAWNSPTIGFLFGYIVGAAVAGLVAYAFLRSSRPVQIGGFILAGLLANVAIYACGVIGLIAKTGMSFTAALAILPPFIVGDVIKSVLAALIAVAVFAALPAFNPRQRDLARDTVAQAA